MAKHSGRPKRAAEDFARTHHDHDLGAADSKKPRFDIRNPSALAPDALEDDVVLDADVIGKRGQQVRRKAVNVDGYDSDSENENFNTRAEAKAKATEAALKKSKDEEENDMFADLEDDFKDGDDSEGDDKRRGGKKKDVRFLDADEIEGQIQSSRSGGHVSVETYGKGKGKSSVEDDEHENSSESEVDDATRASIGELDAELGAGSKKTHAPKLDAFNMRSENEEGRFDDQGNYVRKAVDPDAIHDVWLEGVSKKEMQKAKEAHEQREVQRREKDIRDDSQSNAEVLRRLIPLLEQGETVLEALTRLGRMKAKTAKQGNRHKKYNTDGQSHESTQVEEREAKRKETIETITEAADMLLTRGQNEIYESEKELLLRQYRRETGNDFVNPSSDTQGKGNDVVDAMWEYRWADARDGGEIHGPYDGSTMKQWNDAGYFGEGVEFRRQNALESWSHAVQFV